MHLCSTWHPVRPAQFVEDVVFLCFLFLESLSKLRHTYECGFMFGSLVLFRSSTCLILSQYNVFFITVTLSYRLKSLMVIPPELLLFFRTVLVTLRFLLFLFVLAYETEYCSFKDCKGLCWILMGIIFGRMASFTMIILRIPWAWENFLFLIFFSISFFID